MKAFAIFGLIAHEQNTNPGTEGETEVGLQPYRMDLSNADGEAYKSKVFTVTATGAGDVATYTVTTGAVAQTTGAPTIARAAAVDHEGNAYAALGNVLALLVEVGTDNEGTVALACSSGALPDVPALAAATKLLIALPPDVGLTGLAAGTVALTFSNAGDSAEVSLVQLENT